MILPYQKRSTNLKRQMLLVFFWGSIFRVSTTTTFNAGEIHRDHFINSTIRTKFHEVNPSFRLLNNNETIIPRSTMEIRADNDDGFISPTSNFILVGTTTVTGSKTVALGEVVEAFATGSWIVLASPVASSAMKAPSATAVVDDKGQLKLRVVEPCTQAEETAGVNWLVVREGSFVSTIPIETDEFVIAKKISVKISGGQGTFKIDYSNDNIQNDPCVFAQVQSSGAAPSSIAITSIQKTSAQGVVRFTDTMYSTTVSVGIVVLPHGDIDVSAQTKLIISQETTDSDGSIKSTTSDGFSCGPPAVQLTPSIDAGYIGTLTNPLGIPTVNVQKVSCSGGATYQPAVDLKVSFLQFVSGRYCDIFTLAQVSLKDVDQPTPDPNASGKATTKQPTALIWIVIGGIVLVVGVTTCLYMTWKPVSRYQPNGFDGEEATPAGSPLNARMAPPTGPLAAPLPRY